MENNKILDIIINLLEGVKNKDKLLINSSTENKMELKGCGYLLNQTIRQLVLPPDHYFVSQKALNLWKQIRDDSIFKYEYRQKVKKNIGEPVVITKFKGSNKTPYETVELKTGETFIYNDVFTDEHIVTVNNIINELLTLKDINYKTVKEVLDKIYICKILKEEDHLIKNKKNRSTDYREVIVEDYESVGIIIDELKPLDVLKELLLEAQLNLEKLQREELEKK